MQYLKMAFFLTIYLVAFLSHAVTVPLIRDETVIFDLLNDGDINLSKSVAKAFTTKESIMEIRRVGLVKNSVQIRAAFRDKTVKDYARGNVGLMYYDSYYNELAAYIISKYLGLNIIPATVLRSIPIGKKGLKPSKKLRKGSLQLWVENSVVLYDLTALSLPYPGSAEYKNHQIKEIKTFDCIIGNVDRHAGNLLVDLNERFEDPNEVTDRKKAYLGKIWAIDHSRSFYRGPRLDIRTCKLSKLKSDAISMQFMQGMRDWKIEELEKRLRASGLSEQQLAHLRLESIEHRFQKVKQHFEEQQRKSGMTDEEYYSSGLWHRVW
ncbi:MULTISPECIES: hypothetical protein [unclassified Shewanella]|uniref:hypothetical protein n=1 Tax=unclassified Shewanella TaxID=196818 RepID=UPI000C82287F|nr:MULTISPECIES: hypothetical protein [unclassified Shewanella]MDO6621166.1 hypothetical protein [Shewanella sp. 6_MG-2023]MDO6639472.1 hypothetical protein [Shewanella sp. 5_MG-2023]MDO6678235.1 hypothetical protein [Shewanella sp. 4_MG-2023]MDO6775972.1 hypothetical protein [Shewanella sp. 3_MG-2023]PMG30252.1 hypothetical protein BCU94_11675 [Shewanella sp. 10N.286.52.C2]